MGLGSSGDDGHALAEITSGPLITVAAFVGSVGGWRRGVLGPGGVFGGAALPAKVVTFFTFLPSFVFILAGGPPAQATHGWLDFTAPLYTVTTAVVGLILKLALFFAYYMLWPHGFGDSFDAMSALIAIAVCVALFRCKAGVTPQLAA